ncbi:hypothetical protein ZHAS_00010718 [Anopheles sinensis]|uniref:Uncharacterized protein n=1 Tax=Anopheles sinensis TaxID=74873 RepID=A0A084VYJ9_ANOSI|nr:hypothetical protein ZHAS_00010718 [Anopheles sinensis]
MATAVNCTNRSHRSPPGAFCSTTEEDDSLNEQVKSVPYDRMRWVEPKAGENHVFNCFGRPWNAESSQDVGTRMLVACKVSCRAAQPQDKERRKGPKYHIATGTVNHD